jgi:hypothetical protein
MALTPGGTPYVESSDLVANYPATSLALAEHIDDVTGAKGLAIISPTSIANSGGSASASGGAVTFTGVTSVSLNGVFTSGFENYSIIFNATQSSTIAVNMRLRAAGTNNTANNYKRFLGFGSSANSIGVDEVSNASSVFRVFGVANEGGTDITIYRPQSAVRTRIAHISSWNSTAGNAGIYFGGGTHTEETAFDGFSLFVDTGTFSGIVRVYGYQNS